VKSTLGSATGLTAHDLKYHRFGHAVERKVPSDLKLISILRDICACESG